MTQQQKILITSALPYANGPLHFGHIAGAYLPGDCYARYMRLKGNDVLYICGSDEYGIAITLSADLAKRSPKEHVDMFHEINKNFFQQLDFSFDHYSRTTWEGHKAPVQQYFSDLMANGYIEERVTDQLFSEQENKFLADRYVVGTCPRCGFANARGDECPDCGASYDATDLINPRSKLSNAPLVHKATKHWFLLLDKFKDRLLDWLSQKSWKPNVVNFIKGYIDDMHPRAITRDMTWGVPLPLPNSEGKVLYVWFDAPIGYISATMEWAQKKGQPEVWRDYWCDQQTKLVHFVGKDNIPFHAAIFPAMTMGQNQPYKLVDELPANEFLKLEGRQFSKSDGWYIDLEDFFKRYTTDQIRYCLAANAPETADAEFTWKDFQLRSNSELAGKFGNFVNRVLVFAKNQCGGVVPEKGVLEPIDVQFLESIEVLANQIAENYESFKLRRVCQLIMELAQAGNVYFDAKHPWSDAKSNETKSRMATTIACCLDCIKALALASFPIMPSAAQRTWNFLGEAQSIDSLTWQGILHHVLPVGQALGQPDILFKKIEDDQIQLEIDKLHAMSKAVAKPAEETKVDFTALKPLVDIEEVRKLDLRVGQVLSAVAVPKSKKLLKLEVDLGFEKRQILAGISQVYKPEEMVGKKIVVVANLKPATLMGLESQGMVLAAGWDTQLEVVAIQSLPVGSVVS